MTAALRFPKPEKRKKARKPLRAKRWGIRAHAPTKRLRANNPKNDSAYRKLVRMFECVFRFRAGYGPCRGPIEAAHLTLSANEKGMGTKVDDTQCAAICHGHHADFDQHRGPFKGMSKQKRYALARELVDETRLLATPDDRDQALAFAELGMGRIEETGDGAWRWVPGPAREEAAACS